MTIKDKDTQEPVSVPHEQGVHVVRSITIDRPANELYAFWREPTNLPEVFGNVKSVQMIDPDRAHWTIELPGGMTTDFDVVVYTDVPNEVISWRSLPGSQMDNAGSVRFQPAPGNRGTEVQLTIEFVPPAGALGQALLKLFGEAPAQYITPHYPGNLRILELKLFGEAPAQYIGQYLREFKQLMETGEKATTKGQTSGREGEVEQ